MIQSDMFAFVRTQAQADTTDAPDSNLTVYARLAYNDILSRRAAWPHLSVRYTVSTVAGTADYPFTTFNVADMDRITSVTSNSAIGWRVQYYTLTDALLQFGSPAAPQSTQASGYTVIGNSTLKFFPTPSSVQPYIIDGFRSAAAWPAAAGSSPDLPRVFDEAICWFMLAKYYLSQEDLQLAAFYMGEYERQVDTFVKNETTKRQSPRPQVMGGNNNYRSPDFFDRVRGALQ